MPDLTFEVTGSEPMVYAVSPHVGFTLRVRETTGTPIHSGILRCQVQLEAARRPYTEEERARLRDIFGTFEQWGRALRALLWSNTNVVVPSFEGETTIQVAVPCSFDMTVAVSKYFEALEKGIIPVSFLFSGTIFFEGEDGALQVTQVPWEKEARFSLPAETWHQTMEAIFPNTGWLCLRRDVFDRLYRFKTESGIPTWEETLERLLPEMAGEVGK